MSMRTKKNSVDVWENE